MSLLRRGLQWAPRLLLPLAVTAAVVALLAPSGALAERSDLVLAALVLFTALGIPPAELASLRSRTGVVAGLVFAPFALLVPLAWAVSRLFDDTAREGVLGARRSLNRSRRRGAGRARGRQRGARARRAGGLARRGRPGRAARSGTARPGRHGRGRRRTHRPLRARGRGAAGARTGGQGAVRSTDRGRRRPGRPGEPDRRPTALLRNERRSGWRRAPVGSCRKRTVPSRIRNRRRRVGARRPEGPALHRRPRHRAARLRRRRRARRPGLRAPGRHSFGRVRSHDAAARRRRGTVAGSTALGRWRFRPGGRLTPWAGRAR